MERELRAEDLFAAPTDVNSVIDKSEYTTTVKLSSCGKLGLPSVLHVKDYSFADTMLFAKATPETESKIVLAVLKNIIKEDIDISKITAQDALEILMTIQGTYYSNYIDGLKYYKDETLNGEALFSQDNIRIATIPINNIKTIPLTEVKTPIVLETNNCKIKFDYPRLSHDVIATEYVENKYAEEENKLSEILTKINLKTASNEEINEYNAFKNKKNLEFLEVLSALQILEYNNKTINSIEEKVEVLKKLPAALITALNSILSIKFKFGIDPNVTFEDEESGQLITRRFNFRFTHFLQTLEYKNADDIRISFGD